MKRIAFICFFLIPLFIFGQDLSLQGRVIDGDKSPVSFVTLLLLSEDGKRTIAGAVSEDDGTFVIADLDSALYTLKASSIGFKDTVRKINLTESQNISDIVLEEDIESLDAAVITAKKPTIRKEPGKLVFNVENTSLSTGDTFSLLQKTPGVLVIGEEIKIKFNTPVVYINDKRVYLSQSELITYLRNLDASIIKSVEVITNPSAKYDAEAGSVLNIITSRNVNPGYKGSVGGRYEQGVFAKYNLNTTHFYKNDVVDLYGSYGISPRKEFKEDDNFIRFFGPFSGTKSIWDTYFTRTTRSAAHAINLISDFTLSEKSTFSFTSNISVSPNRRFNNTVDAEIKNAMGVLDSTFTTLSSLENDRLNLSFNGRYKLKLNDQGDNLKISGNYIVYDNSQSQEVSTDYFLPEGNFIRNNSFSTQSDQETQIITAQTDYNTSLLGGGFETGIKYSNIETDSGIDFFNDQLQIDNALSDLFVYSESIFAAYVDFSKEIEKWEFNLGVRAENTKVNGDSKSLGIVNTQEYFEVFPRLSAQYTADDENSMGISYARSIQRPRYQSLNPFRYFINENNFNGGSPNLVPAIDNKIAVNYNYKNSWFFELYYQEIKDPLAVLTFQDNQNSTLRNIDSNLLKDFQWSFDMVYAASLKSWWYLNMVTSTFYLENEFLAVESPQETYSNNTFGFFAQMYSGLTLSQKHGIRSDVTVLYISNLISGSYDYKNQFNTSISFRKSFWDNRGSLTIGVDDIFNTNNIPLSSRYYNQDNSYFARTESRIFRLGFRYKFGNARLRDNQRTNRSNEGDRLK